MSTPVHFEEAATESGHVLGIVTLDVEATLNSLSLPMIDLIYPRLLEWRDRDDVIAVLFEGAGERAFCAGGDIQALYHAMRAHPGGPVPYAEDFFTREYQLDYLIHCYPKPTVVLGHGVVMGGGLGILGGCSHRVGSEKSRIALPEITIGLFPDAGASQFLARMPRHLALFMGLTGCQLNAADGHHAGLLDYLVPRAQHGRVRTQLLALPYKEIAGATALITTALASFADDSGFPVSNLARHDAAIAIVIDGCDSANLVADFARRLDALPDDDWLGTAVQNFRNGCPATAQIVAEQVSRLPQLSLADMFRMELNIAVHCSRYPDFAEGVRALLIEKDNQPGWQHDDAGSVPRDYVLAHFDNPFNDGHPLANLEQT